MTHDYDNFFNIGRAKIPNAALDHRAVAEGKQRLERAHSARASGGEKKCGDIFHAAKITTKTGKAQSVIERALCLRVFVVNSCDRSTTSPAVPRVLPGCLPDPWPNRICRIRIRQFSRPLLRLPPEVGSITKPGHQLES